MIVLGVDPGLANCGLALAKVPAGSTSKRDLCPVALAAVHTEPGPQRGTGWGMRKAEENLERTQVIAQAMRDLVGEHQRPTLICFEQFSSKNATVMIQMGHVIGAIGTLAAIWGCPVISRTPMEIKAATTGQQRRGVTKEQVMAALDRNFDQLRALAADIPKSRRDHPYDAVGAIVASWDTRLFRAARAAHTAALGQL